MSKKFRVVYWYEDPYDASYDRFDESIVEGRDADAAYEAFLQDEPTGAVVQCCVEVVDGVE